MSETKKITEKEVFALIREAIAGTPNASIIEEYLTKREAQNEKRKEAERERAAKKRAEGDEKQAVIKSLITDEFQTVNDLVARYTEQTGEEISAQGLIAKTKNLVESKQIEKATVKVGDGKRVAYRLYTGEFDEA